MDLKRTIKCSNCGNESNVLISSDLDMKELLIAGKCKCGSALQINYTLVSSSTDSNPLTHLSSQSEEAVVPDLDENLFGSTKSDIDNDMLRDLMED